MKTRLLIVATAIFILAATVGCSRVDSGQKGILWKAMGGTQQETYGEGWHFVLPVNRMIVYDVRIKDEKEVMPVISSNGLSFDIEVSVRFRPKPDELFALHTEIGYDYYDKVIAPTIRSVSRNVGGQYLPEEIYSTKRAEVEDRMYKESKDALADKHIDLQTILIREVKLPPQIQKAINDKLEEEQRALKMQFVLDREKKEADRKRIEAQGIADFQRIVSQGISEQLLQWKGIEATQELAKSSNAKVVIIGSGEQGLPVILGQ